MTKNYFYLISVIILFLSLRLASVDWGVMNIDEAHAAVIANSILEGKMPYKDAIDHRGPATYYLFALIFFLFGKNNMLAVHYCLIVLVALETFLIFMLGKKCFNTAAGLFAALFFAVFSWVNNPDDMWVFHTEWGVIVFSTLASICLIKAIKNNPFYFLISGIIFGMSFLSKQAGALDFGSALTFLVIVHLIRGRDTKKIILKLSLISIGFMLPYCLFVVYVSLKKALPDFLFYFWEYNTKYYLPAITLLEKFRRVPLFLFTFFEKRWLYLVFISLGISMTLNRLKLIKDNNAEAQYLLYFSLWSLAAIVSCCVTGRMFLHYGIQIFPPACILAGLSFEKISKKIWQSADEKDSVLKGSCQFFIGSLLFLGILLPSFRISLDYHKYMFTKKQIHPVSEYIFKNSSSTDTIFVWGFADYYYVESQRMPASRYNYCNFLTGMICWTNHHPRINTDYAIIPGAWEHFLREMEENKPKFIVDTSPANLWNFGKYPMSRYPALSKIIKDYYILDPYFSGNKHPNNVTIYVRTSN